MKQGIQVRERFIRKTNTKLGNKKTESTEQVNKMEHEGTQPLPVLQTFEANDGSMKNATKSTRDAKSNVDKHRKNKRMTQKLTNDVPRKKEPATMTKVV